MLNHGLNHGFFLLLFKQISCPIHWNVCVLVYLNFIFKFLSFWAVLVLPKTANSGQTYESMSFIWIVWSNLLCISLVHTCHYYQLTSYFNIELAFLFLKNIKLSYTVLIWHSQKQKCLVNVEKLFWSSSTHNQRFVWNVAVSTVNKQWYGEKNREDQRCVSRKKTFF